MLFVAKTVARVAALVAVLTFGALPDGPSYSAPLGAGKPDLTVGTIVVFASPGPWGIATFGITTNVRNQGDGVSTATTLRYYRSTDATITMSDTEEATAVVAALAASASTSESVDLTPPATPGTYYYGACVDEVPGESDTDNNCSGSVQTNVNESGLDF